MNEFRDFLPFIFSAVAFFVWQFRDRIFTFIGKRNIGDGETLIDFQDLETLVDGGGDFRTLFQLSLPPKIRDLFDANFCPIDDEIEE